MDTKAYFIYIFLVVPILYIIRRLYLRANYNDKIEELRNYLPIIRGFYQGDDMDFRAILKAIPDEDFREKKKILFLLTHIIADKESYKF